MTEEESLGIVESDGYSYLPSGQRSTQLRIIMKAKTTKNRLEIEVSLDTIFQEEKAM
jgi:hypothetical protein